MLLVALCLAAGLAVGLITTQVSPLILLALIPVLAVGAWALRDEQRALWLLIAVIGLLPRVAAPVKFLITPTALDAALVLLGLAWLFRLSQMPLRLRDIPITLPLFGLVVAAILTFILGLPNGALTPLILRRFAELVLSLLMVFVIVAVLRDGVALRGALRALVLVGALAALIGILLYVLPDDLSIRLLSALRPLGYPAGPDVLRFVDDDPALMQRATGLWIDPNAYGGYLMVTGALALPQLFTSRPVLPRWLVAVSLSLTGLALVLTASRGAILGLLFVAVLIGVLRYRRLLLLVATVIILALVLPQTRDLIGRFTQGFAAQDLATQMRLGEYKDAFRLIARYPLLGVGFADTPDVDLYIGVSSMYLLIAQQMGLLGVTAFLGTMLALFVSAARAWRTLWLEEAVAAVWLGACGAVAGALISGVVDHYFFNIDFHNSVMLLWLMVALAVGSQVVLVTRQATALH